MLPSFAILLPLAALLPRALSAPSPRGGGLGLAALGGVIVADAANGDFSRNTDSVPDSGYDPTSSCTYTGASAAVANYTPWQAAMAGCLLQLNATNWNGAECTPTIGGVTFGYYKGENDYTDPVDCFNRCAGCLSAAINATQAVTTKCQYEYKTHELVGYKTHTCTMGFDAGS